MSIQRIIRILLKDLRLGPRSPIFMYALLYPALITLVVQVIFGTLFESRPRMGIVDQGRSEITELMSRLEGIEVTLLQSVPELKQRVEGKVPPVEVEINTLGDEQALPLATRLLPLIVLLALFVAGLFVPAFGLVEEREKKTLNAVLVTPVRLSEVLVAKAGMVARDVKTLFTFIKTLNVILLAPVVFYIFPDWPQWIAKFFPTYWVLDPIFEISTRNANLAAVGFDLGVAMVICGLLIVPLWSLQRRTLASH